MLEDPGWGAHGDQGAELGRSDQRALAVVAVVMSAAFALLFLFFVVRDGLTGAALVSALSLAGLSLVAGVFIVGSILLDDPKWRSAARWVLASEWRTWALLAPALAAALIDVLVRQGWGSAVLSVPGAVGYYALVRYLRGRLGLTTPE